MRCSAEEPCEPNDTECPDKALQSSVVVANPKLAAVQAWAADDLIAAAKCEREIASITQLMAEQAYRVQVLESSRDAHLQRIKQLPFDPEDLVTLIWEKSMLPSDADEVNYPLTEMATKAKHMPYEMPHQGPDKS